MPAATISTSSQRAADKGGTSAARIGWDGPNSLGSRSGLRGSVTFKGLDLLGPGMDPIGHPAALHAADGKIIEANAMRRTKTLPRCRISTLAEAAGAREAFRHHASGGGARADPFDQFFP
ncbi:hypothetical protein GCM10023067_09450 [Aminobacter aganoensis]